MACCGKGRKATARGAGKKTAGTPTAAARTLYVLTTPDGERIECASASELQAKWREFGGSVTVERP